MDFRMERDLALCGLACVLCSETDCLGCKARGCAMGSDCSVYKCAMGKGLDGCYQCDQFPCGEGMLQGVRNRAFNRYARRFGKEDLLNRLRINRENGISYHNPGGLKGDYDAFETEGEILRLLRFGTHDPYAKCPEFDTEHFALRLVRMEDAEDLLACYSDPKAQPLFHREGCTSDFRYQRLEEMQECIAFWLEGYRVEGYVRFAIIDKASAHAIGTIEMFGKVGQYKTPSGILRLDIASKYEKEPYLSELFSLCAAEFFPLFDVEEMMTKAIPSAGARIAAVSALGFAPREMPGRKHIWGKNAQR